MACSRRTLSELLAKILVLSAVASTAWGQTCQQQVSDSSFAAIHGQSVQGFVSAHVTVTNSGSPNLSFPSLTYQITRVVGPGTNDEFDTDGFLKNWDSYWKNGVLSRYACITLGKPELIDGGVPPGVTANLVVYVNGHESSAPGTISLLPECGNQLGCSGSVPLNTREGGLKILTKYLKFPHRASAGSQPTAAINNIVIVMKPGTQIDNLLGAFLIGNLTIKAMAPIVLVHGIRADASWFPGNGFTTALDAAKVPYVPAQEPGLQGLRLRSIVSTGAALGPLLPQFAKQFGATKVHIVAHSKGGLWSRYALQQGGPYSSNIFASATPNNFGVLSLTTLDTPHHGSILADVAAGTWHSTALRWLSTQAHVDVDNLQTRLAPLFIQLTDVTREAMDGSNGFNRNYPGVPSQFKDVDGKVYSTRYRSVAADADQGDKVGSISQIRILDSNDITHMDIFRPPLLAVAEANAVYHIVGQENVFHAILTDGKFRVPSFNPFGAFTLNDLVVTINSARYSTSTGFNYPFVPILDPIRKNHSTIGDASIAGNAASMTGVLGEIRRIQPVN